MRRPDPIIVTGLFYEERAALLDLLRGLTEEGWKKQTVCAGWSVRDVALHILGVDLGNIAVRRDRFKSQAGRARQGEDIVAVVNRINDEWVEGATRLSPRLIIDLLAFVGPQLFDYFASLDLMVNGGEVSWAGLRPAPVWLDVAREYTERWHHQQHIRDAVGKPGLTDRHFMAPVLAAFVYALPPTFREIDAAPGTTLHLHISGEAGGDWGLVREEGGWTLYSGEPEAPNARVDIDQDTAWRLFTKGIKPEEARKAASFRGDKRLGEHLLNAVAIIA